MNNDAVKSHVHNVASNNMTHVSGLQSACSLSDFVYGPTLLLKCLLTVACLLNL